MIPAVAISAPISPTAFSGSESLIDFTPGFQPEDLVSYQGASFVSFGSGGLPEVRADLNWSSYFDNVSGASLGSAFSDRHTDSRIRIDFTSPANRVGVLLSTAPVTAFTLTAFDDTLAVLGTTTVTMPASFQAVFAGLEFGSNITRIEITEPNGDNENITLLDDLRFESTSAATAAPEPSSLLIWACAAITLGMAARRQQLRNLAPTVE